jgi:hypothetical protein
MVQDVIDRLKTLQDVLSKKFRIEQEIKELPRTLSTKTELVNRMKKSYIEKNTKYDEVKARIRDLRTRMEEAERERERYEQQMDMIQTQREYEALDKEIREATEREQQLRKELQKEDKVLEEMSQELEREEGMIKEQEKELQEEQEKIETDTESKRQELAELEQEEQKLIPGLDEELLFKFERIIRSKEGEGIVPLKNGVCTGCQMILPNQFVNDVRKGQDILFCPYCSKIVFYVGDEESSEEETEAEGLADVISSFADQDEEGLDVEDVLDEEPLEIGSDDDESLEDDEPETENPEEEGFQREGVDEDEQEDYDYEESEEGQEAVDEGADEDNS